jgi:hypothetical protein
MSVSAAIRPDSVNLPLFLHVLGAMGLTGTLFTVAAAMVMGRRRGGDTGGLNRFALKTVLMGVLPAFVLMRVGAQWTESQENLPKQVQDSAWLGIGYITADLGALLVLISIVLAVIGLRRIRAGEGGQAQARAVGIISILLLVAYVVTVWAMSAKPE